MRSTKQINIKNRPYYFFDDMINTKILIKACSAQTKYQLKVLIL